MELLPALARAYGDRPDAVTVGAEVTSWERLARAADALAAQLTGARVVAVHATPSLATVVAIVAGLRAGLATVPVPPDSGVAELRHILTDSGARLLLHNGCGPEVDIPTRVVDVTAVS